MSDVTDQAIDAACARFWGAGWRENPTLQPLEDRRTSMRNTIEAALAEQNAELEKKPVMRQCRLCGAPRAGDVCHKCGVQTFVPHPDWEDLAIPDIAAIQASAREVGYAIGVHGSLERDVDLIAAPWTDSAVDAETLFQHIAEGINATVIHVQEKPLGRIAATLNPDGWFKLIDISVCAGPALSAANATVEATRLAKPEADDEMRQAQSDATLAYNARAAACEAEYRTKAIERLLEERTRLLLPLLYPQRPYELWSDHLIAACIGVAVTVIFASLVLMAKWTIGAAQ